MAKKKYDELSKDILNKVGGKENIARAYHCMTRLRLDVKDKGVVNIEELEKLTGVVGSQWNGNQLQVIIGQEVDDLYVNFCKVAGIEAERKIEENLDKEKKKISIGLIFQTISAILLPVIPALAGAGMIKGLSTIMTSYLGVDSASTFITVMNMAGDCAFYFLPFLVAWSSSKRFETNTALAISLTGVLLYPTMTAGNAAGAEALSLFGLPIPFPRYFGSTIPIILTVLVLSYVYKYINNCIPKSLQIVFTPTLVLLIMTPLTLVAIGPLAMYISTLLVGLFNYLYQLSPSYSRDNYWWY